MVPKVAPLSWSITLVPKRSQLLVKGQGQRGVEQGQVALPGVVGKTGHGMLSPTKSEPTKRGIVGHRLLQASRPTDSMGMCACLFRHVVLTFFSGVPQRSGRTGSRATMHSDPWLHTAGSQTHPVFFNRAAPRPKGFSLL